MSITLKNRIKSYSFWVSLASAILLLVQTVGRPLGLVIDEATYMSIVNSVLGVFVVLGIVSHPAQSLLKSSADDGVIGAKPISKQNTVSIRSETDAKVDFVEDLGQNQAKFGAEEVLPNKTASPTASEQTDGALAQNSLKSTAKVKMEAGITIDSKSGGDVGENYVAADANSDLSPSARARLDNFRQELKSLYDD